MNSPCIVSIYIYIYIYINIADNEHGDVRCAASVNNPHMRLKVWKCCMVKLGEVAQSICMHEPGCWVWLQHTADPAQQPDNLLPDETCTTGQQAKQELNIQDLFGKIVENRGSVPQARLGFYKRQNMSKKRSNSCPLPSSSCHDGRVSGSSTVLCRKDTSNGDRTTSLSAWLRY